MRKTFLRTVVRSYDCQHAAGSLRPGWRWRSVVERLRSPRRARFPADSRPSAATSRTALNWALAQLSGPLKDMGFKVELAAYDDEGQPG